MKKTATLIVILTLCLMAVPALAAPQFTVDGSLLFGGNYQWKASSHTYEANSAGLVVDGSVTGFGPLGALISCTGLAQSGFTRDGENPPAGWSDSGKYARLDLLGSYALPLGGDRAQVKVLGGVTRLAFEYTADGTDVDSSVYVENLDFSGLAAGIEGRNLITDKLSLGGRCLYVPSLKFDYTYKIDGATDATDKGSGSDLSLRLTAAYRITSMLSGEAGYRTDALTYHYAGSTTDRTRTTSGFTAGLRAEF